MNTKKHKGMNNCVARRQVAETIAAMICARNAERYEAQRRAEFIEEWHITPEEYKAECDKANKLADAAEEAIMSRKAKFIRLRSGQNIQINYDSGTVIWMEHKDDAWDYEAIFTVYVNALGEWYRVLGVAETLKGTTFLRVEPY